MAINYEDAKKEFTTNAGRSGEKLVKRYTAATDKLSKATSPEAQANYVEAMSDPEVLGRRLTNLGKLTEEDLNRAMRAKGAAAYGAAVRVAGDKWVKKFRPYGEVMDSVVAGLPAPTRDAMANIDNRLKPIVAAVKAKKAEIG